MIKKLMKYDLKKCLNPLVIFYAISLGLACITRFINIWDDIHIIKIIGTVFASLTYSAVASILVNTIVHLLRMFINSFFKDESYLTHTLPVSKNQLFASKYLTSLIVILLSVIMSFASIFIVLYSKSLMESIKMLLSITVEGLNISGGGFIAIIVLVIFAQITAMMSMGFCAVIKSNTYNTKRVRRGLIWFFAYYFGAGICTLIVAVIAFLAGGMINEFLASTLSSAAFITLLVVAFVAYALYAVVFYFLAKRIFNKGVNVD